MRAKNTIVWFLALSALFCGASLWAAPTSISQLGLSRDGDFTVLTIQGNGPIRYAHEAVEAKEGKPVRIVVDCLASRHNLPRMDFTNLPKSMVTSIRTSQYAATPEEIVRVVLDLREEPVYRVETDGNALKVYISDRNASAFSGWTSGDVAPAAPAPIASVQKPAQTVTPSEKTATPTVQPTTAQKDQKSEPTVTSQQKPTVVVRKENEKSEPTKIIAAANEAKTQATEAKATPPVVLPVPAPAQAKVESKAVVPAEPKSEKPAQPVVATESKTSSTTTSPAAKPPVVVQKNVAKDSIEKAKAFAALTPDQSKASQPVASAVPKPETGKPAEPVQKPAESKPTPPTTDQNLASAVKPEGEKKTEPGEVDLLPAVDTASGPEEAAAEDEGNQIRTSRYRREIAKTAEMKATEVVQFPDRMVIEYASSGERDPFDALIKIDKQKMKNAFLNPIPNAEGLELVGILEPEVGPGAALMEDQDGIGYILRPGDKVQNGFVAQIDDRAVYFQINEYGWGRTVVKELAEQNQP